MSQLFTLMIINENTQLDKVVSPPKGFERYFYAEDKKSIFSTSTISFVNPEGRVPLDF